MKFLVAFALVAVAYADVAQSDFNAPIVSSTYEQNPSGSYQYSYQTGNGIAAQAEGVLKDVNSEYPILEVKGGYRYTGNDGTPIEVTYVANENGFQPQGAHLPVAPPVPAAIQRSLEYIASHPAYVAERVVTAPVRAVASLLG